MKLNGKTFIKNLFSKKSIKITTGILIVAAVGFGVYKSPIVQNKVAATNSVPQRTAAVKKGNISYAVTGTGTLYYDKASVVPSKVSSTVTKVYFKEGDKVKSGDLLVELDDSDAALAMSQKLNALAQSQISSNAAASEISKLSIKTPFSGQISSVAVKKGDLVQKGSTVFTIADTSKLKLMVDFNLADIDKIALNGTVDVNLTSIMQTVQGTVTYKSNKPVSTNLGAQLYSAEISIDNPGAVTEGMPANVSVETKNGTISSVSTGTLEYINKATVISEAMGTVEEVSIKKNQQVNGGVAVVRIKNDDVMRNKENGDLNVSSSKIAIEASEKQLGYYKIYAPIDGTISKQSIKAGDNVNIGDIITTIKETNVVQADIEIDELDIAKVAVGQKARVTIDALPDTASKPIEGEVVKIALDGVAKNGVTNYPVTVRVNEGQSILKGGMNTSAEIQVNNIANVLYIPKEAITKSNGKSVVMLMAGKEAVEAAKKNGQSPASSAQKSQTKNYYSNAIQKEVEVGVSYNGLTEIKSGLKEGDVVILPEK